MPSPSNAQGGLPYVRSYLPKEYKAHSQIFSIAQDKRGVMYFGNMPGILEYDGKNWRYIFICDRYVTVRSLARGPQGQIYAGSEGEFGYLAPDSSGKLKYKSLLHLIPEDERNFTEIWTINIIENRICFSSHEKIFIYENNRVKIIKPRTRFHLVFAAGNNLFTCEKERGLIMISGDSVTEIAAGRKITSLQGVFNYKEDTLLIVSDDHMYLHSGITMTPFPTEADSFLKANRIYRGMELSGGRYSFGTLAGGVLVMDPFGKVINLLNEEKGLNNHTVLCQYMDDHGILWMGLNNGFARAEINNPLTEYDGRNGLGGTISCFDEFEGAVYAGTESGVYALQAGEKGKADRFVHVKGTVNQVFDFLHYGDKLLIAGGDNMYEMSGGKMSIITPEITLNGCLYRSKKFPGRVYVGRFHHFTAIKNISGKWIVEGAIKGINQDIRTIAEEPDGDLWLGTYSEGLIHIKFIDDSLTKPVITVYGEKEGLPANWIQVLAIRDKIFFGTATGVYTFNQPESKFDPDSFLAPELARGERDLVRAVTDMAGNVIVITKGSLAYCRDYTKGKKYLYMTPFLRNEKSEFYAVMADHQNHIWAGGPDGAIRYNPELKMDFHRQYQTLLRTVTSGKDTVFHGTYYDNTMQISGSQPVSLIKAFAYENNTMQFEYTAPYFSNESVNRFSFFLEGFDSTWSEWSEDHKKEYTNLPEGQYKFRVKAINKYEAESNEALFAFYISPPWYRTLWAYAFYGFIFVFIIYAAITVSIARLRKAKIRLEAIVKERTAEIVAKNIELEKLSIVASKTDNGVMICDAGGNIEWINDGFTRMHGYTLDEYFSAKGKNLSEVSASSLIQSQISTSIMEKKSVIYESINTTKAGVKFWVQSTLTPIFDEIGHLRKLVIIDTDITERKRNEEIISEKNKDILDSINYASRIQRTILVPDEIIKQYLPNSFFFFKPKDIVSGDFYFFAVVNQFVLVAAVDCTGHGVPGAFMSLIGNDMLHHIVNDKQVTSAASVLDHLDKRIMEVLHPKGAVSDVKDGMDLSFCALRFQDPCVPGIKNHCDQVQFAGAKRSMIFIRNGIAQEYNGDKYSIGGHFMEGKSFTNHIIEPSEDDIFYIFSDGFGDQFGGSKGKKFKEKKLRELLIANHTAPLKDQKKILDEELTKWMGANEQTDDVTVIGINI